MSDHVTGGNRRSPAKADLSLRLLLSSNPGGRQNGTAGSVSTGSLNVTRPPKVVKPLNTKVKLNNIRSFKAVRDKSDLQHVRANLILSQHIRVAEIKPLGEGGHKVLPQIPSSVHDVHVDGASFEAPKNLGTMAPPEILRYIKNHLRDGFMYMMPAHAWTSTLYHPYDLRIVPHGQIDHENFYTISAQGVQHVREGIAEFTPLHIWAAEYDAFIRVRQMKFFKQFRLWKQYSQWRDSVVHKKQNNSREFLNLNLFLVDNHLQPALLKVRNLCLDVVELQLCSIEEGTYYRLTGSSVHVFCVSAHCDFYSDDGPR